jgi:hypothetical protein
MDNYGNTYGKFAVRWYASNGDRYVALENVSLQEALECIVPDPHRHVIEVWTWKGWVTYWDGTYEFSGVLPS